MFFRLFIFLLAIMGLTACKKESKEVCTAQIISYTSSASNPCMASGSITVGAPAGSGFLYKIGSSGFQSSAFFTPLMPGTYKLTIRSASGCEDTTTATVDAITAGPLFLQVKTVLATNCFPCHTGINLQAGHDWGNSCHILNHWDRIKARAVDGNPVSMPPSGLIAQTERDKITAWINAGHRYTD